MTLYIHYFLMIPHINFYIFLTMIPHKPAVKYIIINLIPLNIPYIIFKIFQLFERISKVNILEEMTCPYYNIVI